jgi:polyhydroxyalkanoate synthesis regulator phasin
MMIEDVKKFMEAAVERLTPAKAQQLAKSLAGAQGKEQVAKYAQELLEWSHRNRERVTELVQREVKAQLKMLGVASRDEVEALRKRVRELERTAGTPKKPVAKKPAAKKPAAKRPAAKKAAS